MSLHPAQFVGRPLPELVAELARGQPPELGQSEVELHGPATKAMDAVTLRPCSMMATTVADADLPADHPDVDVPGVSLEMFLGGGGQGWVYAGRVRDTGHIVAVKILRADGEAAQSSALREAVLCARVRHRNILRVFQAQPAGEFWVVLMELIQGQELEESRLSEAEAKQCLVQLADALVALQSRKILHCDVKPKNILLRRRELSPVLVDFGIARDLNENQRDIKLHGTPYYMAPEALRFGPPHFAWDAYSLGVTAAAMLGVRLPYDDLHELKQAKFSGLFERDLRDELDRLEDARLRDWIAALLHRDPDTRLAALATAAHW